MRVCAPNRYNYSITWATIDIKDQPDLYRREQDDSIGGTSKSLTNELTSNLKGLYGDFILKTAFLDDPEKIKNSKVCRFVWANETGDYDPSTGRFDGAIGYLMDGKAEIFMRPTEYGTIDNKFVNYLSLPVWSASISPLQLIDRLANEKVNKSLSSLFHFLMPSTNFLLFLAAASLIYGLSSVLISQLKKPNASRSSKRSSQIKILLFFNLLFLFFIELLYSSNLNTENVVVRIDNLLYSKEQIIQTDKELCFIEKSFEFDFLKNAPTNSFLHKIYRKINKSNPCFLIFGNKPGNFLQKELNQVFTLFPNLMMGFITDSIQMIARKDTYQEKTVEIYQTLRSFVIKKDLSIEKQNYFDRYLSILMELGWAARFNQVIPPVYEGIKFEKRGSQDGFVHHDGLQDYIAANTRVTALSFDKLDYLLRIYFALVTAIFFLNLLHYCVVTIVIPQIRNWLFSIYFHLAKLFSTLLKF